VALRRIVQGIIVVVLVASPLSGAGAGEPNGGKGDHGRAAAHWTAARRAQAQPRDLVIDHRGLGYLRRADGTLTPHGHATPAAPAPNAKPGGGTADTTPPTTANPDPGSGATIGASHTFSAKVTDASGVRSVTFQIARDGGSSTSFAAAKGAGDVWSVTLQGFTDGSWSWSIVARDAAKGAGNTATTGPIGFTVSTSGGDPGPGPAVVTNDAWTTPGTLQTAAGRIYFEMPSNRRQTRWSGYVCSGTVATDGTPGRSVILTAAHCVYDDANKAFARNVLFIPDQDGTTGAGTDTNCGNDPLGCWAPSFGVVDTEWTTRTFPDNIPWDYAYYVVSDPGHEGYGDSGPLDEKAGSLAIQFSAPTTGDVTHALGYSYSDDPNFMYCAEAMGTEGAANWWLPNCGLSGGSSGGPWVQPMGTDGTGPIISVNSWGYTNQPGMAGPKLAGTSASCLFALAKGQSFPVADRGVAGGC
jgi:hypothetical protein